MANVESLKHLLNARKSSWSIRAEVPGSLSLEELAQPYSLGARKADGSMRKTFRPRIRPPLDNPIMPVRPGMNRLERRALGGGALPSSWDWRDVDGQSYVGSARDQGGCGSCVSFATVAAIEAHQRIARGTPAATLDLSEASLFFVANRQCNAGDPRYGWWVPDSLDAAVTEGVCSEATYPYRAVNQTAELADGSRRTVRIHGYDSSTSVAQMKRWLAEDGPLVTAFDVYYDFFAFFNAGAGVYRHVTGALAGGHAVSVIGYDDAQSAWICKNSWGSTAGHPDGCFLIGYGECDIDDRMYVPQDVVDIYTIDQISYDPSRLVVVDRGALGWMLTDGSMSMRLFDNAEDARNGLRVARRHTRQCFVGRDNPRTNRRDYILEYWDGHSGLAPEPLTRTDSISYRGSNVVATDIDDRGWRLREGDMLLLQAHDMNDALAMLQVVERHSRMSFIGRGNARPNRKDYIMTYFE